MVIPISEAQHGKHEDFLCPVQFRIKRGNFGSWDLKIVSSSYNLWYKFYMVVSSHSSSTSPIEDNKMPKIIKVNSQKVWILFYFEIVIQLHHLPLPYPLSKPSHIHFLPPFRIYGLFIPSINCCWIFNGKCSRQESYYPNLDNRKKIHSVGAMV